MLNEFHDPNYLYKVFQGPHVVAQAPGVPQLGPEPHGDVGDQGQ